MSAESGEHTPKDRAQIQLAEIRRFERDTTEGERAAMREEIRAAIRVLDAVIGQSSDPLYEVFIDADSDETLQRARQTLQKLHARIGKAKSR